MNKKFDVLHSYLLPNLQGPTFICPQCTYEHWGYDNTCCLVFKWGDADFCLRINIQGSPTYTVFTTADPTTAVFGLCTCKLEWILRRQNLTVYYLMINIKSLDQILNVFFQIELLSNTSVTLKFQPSYIDFLNSPT